MFLLFNYKKGKTKQKIFISHINLQIYKWFVSLHSPINSILVSSLYLEHAFHKSVWIYKIKFLVSHYLKVKTNKNNWQYKINKNLITFFYVSKMLYPYNKYHSFKISFIIIFLTTNLQRNKNQLLSSSLIYILFDTSQSEIF